MRQRAAPQPTRPPTILDLRRRKGCDFYHFTNGDNVYHIDYFFYSSEYSAFKSTVLTGVDFFSHLVAEDRARRGQPYESSPAHLRVKSIDLAAMLFKARYLDRKNMTFIVRRYERGKRRARDGGVQVIGHRGPTRWSRRTARSRN